MLVDAIVRSVEVTLQQFVLTVVVWLLWVFSLQVVHGQSLVVLAVNEIRSLDRLCPQP